MQNNYSYPLMEDWNQSELITVINFYQLVEQAYENNQGVARNEFLNAYRNFTNIVPSKMEQKQLEKEFKTVSTYDIYQVFKMAKNSAAKYIKM
ncbi:UPF0223 family protein [Lentilactobacillus senioris]|uniref:UPF0223 family protein n=1 Tax=Lentilactobacillus senioris TaxID=931534 RepID=UPI0022821809|nr:UPF0223 family protein [Lentilactobacillus senioris]MCY9807520.1 UPF0223 family protein [Lentilactobacillus senioris]